MSFSQFKMPVSRCNRRGKVRKSQKSIFLKLFLTFLIFIYIFQYLFLIPVISVRSYNEVKIRSLVKAINKKQIYFFKLQ